MLGLGVLSSSVVGRFEGAILIEGCELTEGTSLGALLADGAELTLGASEGMSLGE